MRKLLPRHILHLTQKNTPRNFQKISKFINPSKSCTTFPKQLIDFKRSLKVSKVGLLYVTWSNEQFSSCLDPLSLKPHLPSFSSFLILWEFLEFFNSFAAFFNTKIRQTFSQINLRHSACLLLNIEILPESKVHSFIHYSILNNLKNGRLFKVG